MAQHKHAALIKAWADGAEIEYQSDSGDWYPVASPPWGAETLYRIKPRVEQRRYRVALFKSGQAIWTETVDIPAEADHTAGHKRFHSWLTDWVEYEVEVQP